MSLESDYASVAAQLVAEHPSVDSGRMLHAAGLHVAGKFFAFTSRGELVAKLPAARVEELIEAGSGRPCEIRRGSPMREWVRLSPPDRAACAAYLAEALDFVAGLQRSQAR